MLQFGCVGMSCASKNCRESYHEPRYGDGYEFEHPETLFCIQNFKFEFWWKMRGHGPRLDDIGAVVVEVPELAVVLLVRPPEGVGARGRVDLALLPHAPPNVKRERVTVLLEQRVDARDAAVPRIL